MIALINSFSVQKRRLTDSLGGNGIANSFSVQTQRLTDSLGGNRVAGAFSVAHGGYEIDGVILPKELDINNFTRHK